MKHLIAAIAILFSASAYSYDGVIRVEWERMMNETAKRNWVVGWLDGGGQLSLYPNRDQRWAALDGYSACLDSFNRPNGTVDTLVRKLDYNIRTAPSEFIGTISGRMLMIVEQHCEYSLKAAFRAEGLPEWKPFMER